MNPILDVLSRALRAVLKLVLVLAATVFVVSFLLAALLVAASLVFVFSFLLAALFIVLGVSLWSLITGRKPAPVVMFSRMREQSQRYTQGVWPGRGGQPPGDVVDVEVTEVREVADRGAAPLTVERLR